MLIANKYYFFLGSIFLLTPQKLMLLYFNWTLTETQNVLMPTVSDDDKFAFKISCDWSLSYRTVAESLFGVILTNIRVGVEKKLFNFNTNIQDMDNKFTSNK